MVQIEVSLASERGVRAQQEDSYGTFRMADWECYAIADGYGKDEPTRTTISSEVIALLLQSASHAFEEHLDITAGNYRLFFESLYQYIDEKTHTFVAGSTLVVSFHCRQNHTFYTAALGDSIAAHLTSATIATNPHDYLTHSYHDLWGSFGDTANATFHHKKPECRVFEIRPGEALLLASDGLFTHHGPAIKQELITDAQRILTEKQTAADLIRTAQTEKKTNDNATAIVIRVL